MASVLTPYRSRYLVEYEESLELQKEKLRRLALATSELLETLAQALRQIEEAANKFNEAVENIG